MGALSRREKSAPSRFLALSHSLHRGRPFASPGLQGSGAPGARRGWGAVRSAAAGTGHDRRKLSSCLHQVSLCSSPPSLALHPLLSLLGDLNVSANSAVPRCRVVVPTSFFTLRRGVNHPTLESALREGGAGAIKQPVKFLKPPACSQVCKQVSQTC